MFNCRRHYCRMGVVNRHSNDFLAPLPAIFPAVLHRLKAIAGANMAFAETDLAIAVGNFDDVGVKMVESFL